MDYSLELWKEHSSEMSVDSIIESYNHPAVFQRELSDYINQILNGTGTVIEVGCEQGITSFLIDCEGRCFFDLNDDILEKVKQAKDIIQPDKTGDSFVCGNMFQMPFGDKSFNVAFNAGVIEHYGHDEVVYALKEMARVSKDAIVVAIPNHHCIVYRSAYLFRMLIHRLGIKKWPFPPENKYYDLHNEIEAAGLRLEKRIVMSKDSIWNWWGGTKFALIRLFFRIIDMISPIEGYLTVLLIKKPNF